jgi:hypothetical protein
MFHNGYKSVLPVSVRLAEPGVSTASSATGAGVGRFLNQPPPHAPWNFLTCTTFFSSLKHVVTLLEALAGSESATIKPLDTRARAVRDRKRFLILNIPPIEVVMPYGSPLHRKRFATCNIEITGKRIVKHVNLSGEIKKNFPRPKSS